VVLPVGQTALSLNYEAVFASGLNHTDLNTGYLQALEASGVTIVINATQADYAAAVAALNGYVHGSVSLTQSSAESVTLTYADFVSTSNAAYVHSLEAAGDIITVQAASNSLADYNAAVLALHGYGNGSVALGAAAPVALTYNDFTSTANTAYVAALKATGSAITLTATSTSLTDYDAALSALGTYGHGSSVSVPVLTSAVTLSYGDFVNNGAYVTALEAAGVGLTTIINVTATSDSLADYNALVSYITAHQYTHISVVLPSSATPITLTYADFTADTAYVHAMSVAENSMIVTGVPAAGAAAVHTIGVISYTLNDTLANLEGAANGLVSGATSYHLTNADIDLGTLAVAGVAAAQATAATAAAALLAGADNSPALTLHATYTLSDTLANLAGAGNGVVSGAASYHLTDANIDLGTLAVAGVAGAQAAAAALVAGADNSPALTLHATYTLSDTLVNLEGAGNGVVSGATSYHLTNANIDLGTLAVALAVAGVAGAQATAAALVAGADNSQALTLHATYTLSDTLVNLEGAANGVVSGATSYHLTNANIDLGTLAVAGVAAAQATAATAAAALLAGADNSPALTLHATYTLSDTLVNLEGAGNGVVSGATSYHLTNADIDLGTLAVAGVAAAQATAATAAAALLAGADNSPALTLHATYTLSDTLVNLEGSANGVVSGATSYHLTNANVDLGALAVANVAGAQSAAATAAAALLAGADNSPALTLNATYTLSDTAADYADATGNLANGVAALLALHTNVNISNVADVAQLYAIKAAGSGTVTASGGISDTAADYAATSGVLTNGGGALATGMHATVTDAASVAQLSAIKTKIGISGTLTASGGVSDTAADYASAGGTLTFAAAALAPGMNATVTGVADLAQLLAIQSAIGSGLMTNNGVSDTAANLFNNDAATLNNNASHYLVHGENVTLSGNGASAPSLVELQAVKQAIGSGTLTYTSVSDNYTNLLANSNAFVHGNINVTVTDTTGISIANLVALQGETTGIITATSITDTAANVQSNSSFIKGGVTTVTLYDTAAHLLNSSYATAVGEATAINILAASGTADTISAANLHTLESEATLNAIDHGANALTISDTVSNLNSALNDISAVTSGGHAPAVYVSQVSTVSAAVAETFFTNYALGESMPLSATAVNTSYNASQSAAIIVSDSAAHILNAANAGAFALASAVDVTGSVNSASLTSLATLDPTAAKIDLSAAVLSMSSLTATQVEYLNSASGSTTANAISVTGITGNVDLASVSNASAISLTMGVVTSGTPLTIVVGNASTVTNLDITALTGESGGNVTYSAVGQNLQVDVTGTNIHIELVGMSTVSHAGLHIVG